MYESYFKLSGKPFQLTPDPYFFFGSSGHNRALAYVRYGLSQGEGFIVVSGDIGSGKSTLVRTLFANLENKKDVVAAELMNTQLDSLDILRMSAAAYGLAYKDNDKTALLKNLESFFKSRIREGKRCILVVDEAQNLPLESLEELRMLSNLQFDGKTLLQILLLGQPEFIDNLQAPGLEQLRQRVTASYHLNPLSKEESREYIEHRLNKVDWDDNPHFTGNAYEAIFLATQGVPRRINTLCDRLMLYAFLEEKQTIDREVVKLVKEELQNEGIELGSERKGRAPVAPLTNGAAAPAVAGAGLSDADRDALLARMAEMEQDMKDMKARFNKEREYMRKIVAISLNFDEE